MMADPLHHVLQQLSPVTLHELIGEDRLTSISAVLKNGRAVSIEQDPSALADLLLVIYGTQLLEDTRVRSNLLGLLPPEELQRLAEALTGHSFEKTADNVLALASLPWRPGAAVALEIIRRLNLPVAYLPKSAPPAVPTSVVRPSPNRPPLRDYQEEVKERVKNILGNGSNRVLVQMPTGAGKTRTMMDTLADLALKDALFRNGLSVMWLSHVEELCEQAAAAFEDTWMEKGDAPATIVRAWGGNKPNIADYSGSFVVASYQKLVAVRKQQAEFEHIRRPMRIIVADEAHKVIAPTFEALLQDLAGDDDVALIGLTATPGRGLELGPENAQLASFFHKNLIAPSWSGNPIRDLRKRGILAKVRHQTIESETNVALTQSERAAALETDLPGVVLARLADSVSRNRRLIDAIRAEIAAGHPCLVFACTVEHSRMLTAILNLEGARAAHLDSSISRGQRREIIAGFRSGDIDVLLNFGVLSTGFDVPHVSAVVIARPTTSVVLYSQMIGRGLRGPASGGSNECSLIDVRDNFLSFGAVDDVYRAFAPYWE